MVFEITVWKVTLRVQNLPAWHSLLRKQVCSLQQCHDEQTSLIQGKKEQLIIGMSRPIKWLTKLNRIVILIIQFFKHSKGLTTRVCLFWIKYALSSPISASSITMQIGELEQTPISFIIWGWSNFCMISER